MVISCDGVMMMDILATDYETDIIYFHVGLIPIIANWLIHLLRPSARILKLLQYAS